MLQTHTLRICNTYCFPTVKIVSQKRVNVVLYISFSVTLRRTKITHWMADEWCTGRHGGWGDSENNLVKIRIKMIRIQPHL